MDEKGEKVLKYPLQVLSWCGQNPEKNKAKYVTIARFYLLLGAINFTVNVVQFFYVKGNVVEIVQNCEACGGFAQAIVKAIVGSTKIDNIRQMIEDIKHFWSVKKCFAKPQIELEGTFMQTLRLEKIYFRLVVSGGIIIMILPIFTKQLPTGAWIIKDYDRLYPYALFLQEFFMPLLALYSVGYDCLFLSSCVLIRTQFRMLHYLLEDLTVTEMVNKINQRFYLNKLRTYVEYHAFLLRFSRNMQDIYSPIMLSQYSTSLMLLFSEMYGVFESKDVYMFPRTTVIITSALLQLGFYCIPLNYVTDEAVLVSQGIYESDWHSKPFSILKTAVPLLIQRSQREIIFKAGGMFEMNCGTVLSVVKISYSLCTIARGLKNV